MTHSLDLTMFPARAGMSLRESTETLKLEDVPRASGDEPVTQNGYIDINTCSPRERG